MFYIFFCCCDVPETFVISTHLLWICKVNDAEILNIVRSEQLWKDYILWFGCR